MSKVDLTPLTHAACALTMQCSMGVAFGLWATGGIMACIWFIAREHTQAEYRWITQFGNGKRSSMPWWGGFSRHAWNLPSLLDWLVPVLGCTAVYFVAIL